MKSQTNYNQPGAAIINDQHVQSTLKQSQDVIVVARGPDGQPQFWASGDPQKAETLFRDTAKLLNIREFAQG